MRKKFYRQAKKAICIATLSATVLSSIPMIPYTQAYAKGQTTMEELQALSLPTENAVTYNLSDASLRTEKTFVDVYGDELTTKFTQKFSLHGTFATRQDQPIQPLIQIFCLSDLDAGHAEFFHRLTMLGKRSLNSKYTYFHEAHFLSIISRVLPSKVRFPAH